MNPIVSVQRVDKVYQQGKVTVKALDDVSLLVRTGEFTALAGPSGSGKTTMLNMIGGLDLPDSGVVVVDGNHFETMPQSSIAAIRLHKIGFVFQAYNLVPVLSAVENVEFIMMLQGVGHRERRDRAKDILDEVGLDGKYDRRPAELSGGQQQRVAVARAIVASPAIVLADEPTANLDSRTGEGLLELMRRMNEEKQVTFIFSTHDRMVMEYARRVVHIKDGRVVDDQVKNGRIPEQ